MDIEPQIEALQSLAPLIEQYEYECLLSERNTEQGRQGLPAVLQAQPKLHISANLESSGQAAAACSGGAPQDAAAKVQKAMETPALYSASHTVSKLAKPPLLQQALDRIRDTPVRKQGQNLSADNAHGYNGKARAQAQRLGRPASSKGAILRASTWFDEVAAPQMQQMCMVQKNAVKVHDQALDQQVQELTASLAQDMQSLQSVGTDVPARLVVDRVRLYVTELMPLIAANRDHVLDVQTQYTDGLEDCVKAVFVRGIEDAIAARDVWHHDKIVAMQLQHEQIMHNLRNSSVVEIRRALHNQSVDLARQHQTKADVVKVQAARDQALLELQELELLHSQLHIKSAAQAQSIEEMVPELEALRKLAAHLQGMEAKCEAAQKELEFSKRSLAETAEALQEWEAAEQQHKALFGPLANLDPEAMASKLDATLAELRLIRERQEQVLEQQEKIRLNAEKAQLQRDMQEQKGRARHKALADKALQRYSGKPAYQPQEADPKQPILQLERLPSGAPTAAAGISIINSLAGRPVFSAPSMAAGNADVRPTADAEMASAPFFTNATARVVGERPAMRRGGIRGASQSPIPVAKLVSQQSMSNFGQTMKSAMVARSASPVFSSGRLQNALQRTLAQLPKD